MVRRCYSWKGDQHVEVIEWSRECIPLLGQKSFNVGRAIVDWVIAGASHSRVDGAENNRLQGQRHWQTLPLLTGHLHQDSNCCFPHHQLDAKHLCYKFIHIIHARLIVIFLDISDRANLVDNHSELYLCTQDVRKVELNHWAAKPPQVWSLRPPPGRIMHTKDYRQSRQDIQ